MEKTPFKTCPNCGVVWQTLNDFLVDPALEQGGYQINFLDLRGGLFYFTHAVEDCGTTMAVPVGQFTSLSKRNFLANRRIEEHEGCSSLCVRRGDLSPCPVECECVWVREVMQVIKERKESAA